MSGPFDFKVLSPRICSFLNMKGGIIYIGITDEGIVVGRQMTRKYTDQFLLNLDN